MTPSPMVSLHKTRILYLIDYWGSPGGTERHLAYLLQSLDKSRYDCSVVVFNYLPNALAERAKADSTEIVHIPVARYYTPNALFRAIQLYLHIRKRRIDLVQTFHYKSDIYGALVAWVAGVRHIVASKRDAADYKGRFRFFMHKLVRPITQHYIAVSGVVAKVIREKEGVPDKRISVIYNGVSLERYVVPDACEKASAKRALGFAEADFVVGMSAWFRPEKDHQLLLDAFAALLQDAPDAKLLLVGSGPLFEQYRGSIQSSALKQHVHLTGAVDDVRPYLRAMDIACLVPRMNEGFSNSVLEKMATGLPLILTDIGGNAEAVTHGENGYIIKPGDKASLIMNLRTLYRDVATRQKMAAAARVRVEQLFSLDQMIDRHAALYDSLINQKERAST